MDHAALGLCAVAPHEILEVDAVQVFHGVIEHAVRRAAVVIDRDGVRVGQHRGQLHLALEPLHVPLADALWRQQLDRGWPPQHRVVRAVYDAHRAFADLLVEGVLSEPAGALHLPSKAEDDI